MWWWLQTTTCVEENIKAETGHHFKRQHPARAFPVAELVKRTASRKKQCAILLSRRSVHKKNVTKTKNDKHPPWKGNKAYKKNKQIVQVNSSMVGDGTRYTAHLISPALSHVCTRSKPHRVLEKWNSQVRTWWFCCKDSEIYWILAV